jgi:putative DNA primase/helicase
VNVVTFPERRGDPDRELKNKIKAEAAGILNWALDGLRRLRERGCFEIPNTVKAATEEFQQNNDIPFLFIQDACIVSEDIRIQSSILYTAYRGWCEDNGHKPQSSRTIADDWKRLGKKMGFEKKTIQGRRFYQGISLKPEENLNQDDFAWDPN